MNKSFYFNISNRPIVERTSKQLDHTVDVLNINESKIKMNQFNLLAILVFSVSIAAGLAVKEKKVEEKKSEKDSNPNQADVAVSILDEDPRFIKFKAENIL